MKATLLLVIIGSAIALTPCAQAEEGFRTDLLGKKTIIQNSTSSWNGEIATIATVYDDGSVRVKLSDGRTATVPARNVEILLAMPTDCAPSHGVQICKNDKVYYPNSAVTIGIPEGEVESVFTNGYALVRDGKLQKFHLSELGLEESSHCSSARPEICRNDKVRAEKIVGREGFEFDGKVIKLYTNGIALVENSPNWKQTVPVDKLAKRRDLEPEYRATRGLASVELDYDVSIPDYEVSENQDNYLPIPPAKQYKSIK